jgi:hypothetical protein
MTLENIKKLLREYKLKKDFDALNDLLKKYPNLNEEEIQKEKSTKKKSKNKIKRNSRRKKTLLR